MSGCTTGPLGGSTSFARTRTTSFSDTGSTADTRDGYATTYACSALIGHARLLGALDVWAGVTKGNHSSEHVLVRLGFERVADMGGRTHGSIGPSAAPDTVGMAWTPASAGPCRRLQVIVSHRLAPSSTKGLLQT
jgi:hypothetical protein